MTVELSQGQSAVTADRIIDEDYLQRNIGDQVNTSHEYELNLLESLSFLYNLLYDDNSTLTKADILSILNSLKEREADLPFTFEDPGGHYNIQGIRMAPSLRRKFYYERSRVGHHLWFTNKPTSREEALKVSQSSPHLKEGPFY